jgi:hypothetical protein
MKSVKLTAILICGILGAAAVGLPAQEKKPPVRPEAAADLPSGHCCLWRLSLTGTGKIEFKLDKPYSCPTGDTARGSGFVEIKLDHTGLPCNEQKLIPSGSHLNAAIHPVRRKDDLNYLYGTFVISDPNQKALFKGDIELMHRVDLFHKPFGSDPCDRRDHLQGWLVGAGENQAKGFLLRAALVARTDPLDQGQKGYAIGATNVDGVVIQCKE